MKCQKCGCELREEQKACFQCGALSQAAGMFYTQEKKRWTPSRNMIIAAAVVLVIWIGLVVAHSMRTIPPKEIAAEWFTAMVDRRVNAAENYVTPAMEQALSQRQNDLRALSDDYYDRVVNGDSKFRIGDPRYDSPKDPKSALVVIALNGRGGGYQVQLEMIKSGRQWLVNKVD